MVRNIEYIKGEKNIVEDKKSIFNLNCNQETTHKYTYKKDFFHKSIHKKTQR